MNYLLLKMCNLLAVNLNAVAGKVNEILKTYVGPILIALGSCGAVYMVVMGVQYAKSETPDKREEVKKRIINAFIGMIVIIGLAVIAMAADWVEVVKIFGYLDQSNIPTT